MRNCASGDAAGLRLDTLVSLGFLESITSVSPTSNVIKIKTNRK